MTENAIESIRPEHLIIIDNASPVGGGQLREWADTYVRNKENLGYAKAVNQGLKLSPTAELIAICNNDIRVSPDWEPIAKEIMKDLSIMSLHFTMLPYDQPFNLGDKIWKTGKERWCTGSFFVMRNSGLFDENFVNSYDDWDIHYRMYQKGFKTAYTNKVQYQHMNSFTQIMIPQREEQDKKNREYFIQKHGDTPENLWMKMFPDQMDQDYQGGFE
jgi:GT2 family glycosyltransferase